VHCAAAILIITDYINLLVCVVEAERMAAILEAILARLSWPQDANHIVNIRSTLDTIKSSLFTNLVDVQTQVSTERIFTVFVF